MYAVEVRDGYKYYGIGSDKKAALDGVNMTVKYGSLYGLLGPSGCGKTTLLSCIVGVRVLNKGSIHVLGGSPGSKASGIPGPRVGYMPQDISLIMTFTIKEIIYYFGRLLGLKKEKIRERYTFLLKLFELTDGDRYLGNCSGGQQRCVSFAASIVHEPELVILDEPTVGLDPLLREKMWHYLRQIASNSGTAIIITTHYIEEARQADCVGIMREGKLLAENNPELLLRILETDTLENAFLHLCLKQEKTGKAQITNNNDFAYDNPLFENHPESDPIPDTGPDKPNDIKLNSIVPSSQNLVKPQNGHVQDNMSGENLHNKFTKNKKPFNGSQLWAIMAKNVLAIIRQPSGLVFVLFFPFIQISCFYAAIGGDPKGLRLGIVSDELTSFNVCSNTSLKTAFAHEYDCDWNKLSCRFIDHLTDDAIEKVYFNSYDEAYREAKRGKIVGFLYFASNFTESLDYVVKNRDRSDDGSVNNRDIQVFLDQTDQRFTFFMQLKLYTTFTKFARLLMNDCHYPEKLWDIPINFMPPIYGSFDMEFNRFIAPAVVITMVFFLSSIVTCAVFVYDRLEGLWVRSLVAGVKMEKMLLAHTIINVVIMIIQSTEVLVYSAFMYGIDNEGSYTTVIILVLLNGFAGMFMGLLVSILCDTYRVATMFMAGIFIPLMTFSGIIWPIEGMPDVLRHFSLMMPFTRPALAIRNIIYKGYSFTEPTVLSAFGITTLWIVIFCALSVFCLRKRR